VISQLGAASDAKHQTKQTRPDTSSAAGAPPGPQDEPRMVDWERVNARLPFHRDPGGRARRKEMWTAIDVNANGFVSLAEITRVSFVGWFFSSSFFGC
jgi:hypothetical protein